MELGFETIGNATLLCHDRGPLLVTDPWLEGDPYFGSWTLSHAIPTAQLESIRRCRYVWISHGHPDHLSPVSLERHLPGVPILLPDHYGGRIARGLRAAGREVRVLEDGVWTPLSERVRVCCLSDYCQDAVLLVDMDGRLLVDSNDAADRGGGDFLRATAARFRRTFLLCLTGYGDADMIHFLDEDGGLVPPLAGERIDPGPGIAGLLAHYGLQTYVPFSTMHRYQRSDSVWANAYTTGIDDFARGFDPSAGEMLPAFVRYDLLREEATALEPAPAPERVREPEEFGDDWSEELADGEPQELERYFRAVSHLATFLGYVELVVGGRSHVVDLARERFQRGITFEAPRQSLMTAVRERVFDDLLIGNFARTTLRGDWPERGAGALYPEFSPYVAKYADNGDARTPEELGRYFRAYRERGFTGPGAGALPQAGWRSAQRYL